MKKINNLKLLLDTAMLIIFILLFNRAFSGAKIHEIAGLSVGVTVIIHLLINNKWVKGVTQKLFNKSTPIKSKIMYVIILLLIIDLLTIIVTGIFISEFVFRGLNLTRVRGFEGIHKKAAYTLLVLIGVHLGLNWNWIMLNVKKLLKIPSNRALNYVAKILAVIVFAFGLYSFNSTNYISRISPISSHNRQGKPAGQFRPEISTNNGQNNSNSKQKLPGNFKGKQDGNFKSGAGGGKGNLASSAAKDFGIVATLAVPVYYLEKLLKFKKKKI